jgi:UDP-2-acetamido-3-amino-2,3-dideoxy-glucuronate N-acetyltransferase
MTNISDKAFIHTDAHIDQNAIIAPDAKIWDLARIRSGSSIGSGTIVGRNAYIDNDVVIGKNCKIQNNALIYSPAVIADGVFVGPGVILTNDLNPRAVNENQTLKFSTDWKIQRVEVQTGASIGAGAICVAPVIIGSWAMVGAGAVVVKDVPNYALVVGNPGKQIGWVGKSGSKLEKVSKSKNIYVCPVSKVNYVEEAGMLRELDEK